MNTGLGEVAAVISLVVEVEIEQGMDGVILPSFEMQYSCVRC